MHKLSLFKKATLICSLGLALFTAAPTYAEHSDNDKYEAMCQMTGGYSDEKYPGTQLEKNKVAHMFRLFGSCGDKPNLLIFETVYPIGNGPLKGHDAKIFESQGKGKYWKMVFYTTYNVAPDGEIVKTFPEKANETEFIKVKNERPMSIIVERYCSAKKGSPIFPSAEGNMVCVSGGLIDDNVLDIAHEDYLRKLNK